MGARIIADTGYRDTLARPQLENWRNGWDSNPRGSANPLAVFKTAAFNHSATLPNT